MFDVLSRFCSEVKMQKKYTFHFTDKLYRMAVIKHVPLCFIYQERQSPSVKCHIFLSHSSLHQLASLANLKRIFTFSTMVTKIMGKHNSAQHLKTQVFPIRQECLL